MSRLPSTPAARPSGPVFDPSLNDEQLLDSLAEKQAESLERINSSQLRRFFGETKELLRQLNARTAGMADQSERQAIYQREFAPRFKMLRSKVAYASRPGGQSRLNDDFRDFLDNGVKKVNDVQQFDRFVRHFEAVVGFMYGKGKVQK